MGSNSHIGNTSSKYARVYQACEPCRIKKVRCNLGSVDNPSDPPCARCRRESKHCYFNVTRKRAPPPSTGNGDADAKAFIARNKRRKTVSSPGAGQDVPGSDGVVNLRRGENDSTESTQSLEAGSPADIESSDLQGKHEGFREALLQNAAYTDEDALDLLYRAGSTSTPGDQHGVPTNQPTPQDPTPQADPQDTAASRGREDALNIWSDVRFVRDGLFSAEEAIIYIDFFHDHLKPFTPILSSTDFKPLSTHKTLIEDNPVLAVTMLMLASRYCTLPGAGAVSRRYLIHERLWESLRTMIMRIFWAQDPCPRSSGVAGGGGGGGGLRTLGTCEALLILTEWHPRSLHFPMGGDDVHMLTSKTTRHKNSFTDQNPLFWLEWSWRSDRLCWSLLGTALTLAIELGLLDDCDNTTMGAREITSGSWRDPAFEDRAFRLGQYLWVYSTQLSGRLGWKYLAPYNLPERPSLLGDDTLNLWTGMAILMRTGNELLFASRQHTMEIIRNGRYIGLLYTFQTSLHEWRKEFDNANLSSIMRMILAIDFGYMRVYFNSLAAQAIMDNTRDGKLPLHRSNEDFVMEIIDGARSILECVLNHLVPDGRLAHIPIRTYSRILTAILFLLKTTYLNVTSPASIESSLVLMARVGKAFQQCSPDDAHLSARWGVLLTTLSSRQIGFMRRKNASQLRDDGMVGNSAVDLQQHSVESHEGGFMAANNNLGELQPQPGSVNSLESLGWYELSNVGHSMDNFCLGGNDVQMMPGVPGVTDEQLDLTIPFSAPYQLYTYL